MCKLNGNKREYLHWLLCFTDDLLALSGEIDIQDNLRDRAEQLNRLVEESNYSASISYYLIFLAQIWDFLGEDAKAKGILRKYNESGANIKVYNISIQKIYLRLEDKYKLLPHSPRRKLLDTITLLTDLNTSRDIQEGFIRAEEYLQSMDFASENFVVEVGLENIIRFLIKCGHIFLNANRFDLMDMLYSKFCVIDKNWRFSHNLRAEVQINQATNLFRRGRYNDAYSIVENLQNQEIHNLYKLRALIIMGDVEANKSWPNFKINSWSTALGLAEDLGIPTETALIYHKIGLFFGTYYPALGISFLRKAETIYSKLGMIDELHEMHLLRAQASMLIHIVYGAKYYDKEFNLNNTQPFL